MSGRPSHSPLLHITCTQAPRNPATTAEADLPFLSGEKATTMNRTHFLN
jgi:hypothetical protein